jgi:hypothetical protein
MNPMAIKNLKFVQGETLLVRIAFANGSVPIDLSGYVFSGQTRGVQNELQVVFGFDTSTLAAGYVTVIIDKIVSANIPVGVYRYDIFATAPDGTATVIAKGNAEVMARVTV